MAGKLEGLSRQLGLQIDHNVVLPEWIAKIQRKGSAGDWRHWFTAADVDFFRSALCGFLREMSYDAQDWALAEHPQIEPEHCSRYVAKLMQTSLKRASQGQEDIRDLETAAADGRQLEMIKLAKRLRQGDGVARDEDAALGWYLKAGELGNRTGAFEAGRILLQRKQRETAIHWFGRAAEQDHPGSFYFLGRYFLERGEQGDFGRAIECFRKGAKLQSTSCVKAYEDMMRDGPGARRSRGAERARQDPDPARAAAAG